MYQDVQRSASDPLYRDLAVLLEAMVVLRRRGTLPIDVDAIKAKLQPLALDTATRGDSAPANLMAVLAWKGGHTAEGRLS